MGGDVKENVVDVNVDLWKNSVEILAVVGVGYTNLIVVFKTHDASTRIVGRGDHRNRKTLVHINRKH